MHVSKHTLLLIAATVWLIAGANILRIGVQAYGLGYLNALNATLSVLVAIAFQLKVFSPLVSKHTARIAGYDDEPQFFLRFFDKPSFAIMAGMMTMGVAIRSLSLAPDVFIAVFYTGLGCALALAGVGFGANYLRIVRASRPTA